MIVWMYLRGLECLSEFMFQLSLVVDSEDTEDGNADSTISPYILQGIHTHAKSSAQDILLQKEDLTDSWNN